MDNPTAFEMAREDAVKLGSQVIRYVEEPCCDVPLSLENPGCVWHGYRSLLRKVAELIPHVRTVETRAQVHALEFFRDGALKEAARMALAGGATAEDVMTYLIGTMNFLLDQLRKG